MIKTSAPVKTFRQEAAELWHTFRHMPRVIYRIVSSLPPTLVADTNHRLPSASYNFCGCLDPEQI